MTNNKIMERPPLDALKILIHELTVTVANDTPPKKDALGIICGLIEYIEYLELQIKERKNDIH